MDNGKRIPGCSHGTLSLIITVVLIFTAAAPDTVRAQAQEEITAPIDSYTANVGNNQPTTSFNAEIYNLFDDAEMEIYIHYYTSSVLERYYNVNNLVIRKEEAWEGRAGETKSTVTVPQAAIKKGKNTVSVRFYNPGFINTVTVYSDSKVTIRKITPSLSLSQITIEPKPAANKSVQVKSVISNSGKGTARNISVILLSGEQKLDEEKITGLDQGRSQPVIFNWTAPAGTYALKLSASASGGYAVSQNATIEVVEEKPAAQFQANEQQGSGFGKEKNDTNEKLVYLLIFTIAVAAIFFLAVRRMNKKIEPNINTGGTAGKQTCKTEYGKDLNLENYYGLLNLSHGASVEDIHRAYDNLIRLYRNDNEHDRKMLRDFEEAKSALLKACQ